MNTISEKTASEIITIHKSIRGIEEFKSMIRINTSPIVLSLKSFIDGMVGDVEACVSISREEVDKITEILLCNLSNNLKDLNDTAISESIPGYYHLHSKFKSTIPGAAGNSSATPAQQTLCGASLNAEDGTAQS